MSVIAWCPELMYPASLLRGYKCGRPAKWLVTTADDREFRVCGIHVRRYRRWSRVNIEALA